MQAMVPAYQKHFTKGDIDNLVAFYSSPTGEEVIARTSCHHGRVDARDDADHSQILGERCKQTLLKQTDEMIAQSKKQPNAKAPATNN